MTVADPAEQQRLIVQALVGTDPELQKFWHFNAEFHHSVWQLARMLPTIVNGFAAAARTQDKQFAENHLETMRTGPHPVFGMPYPTVAADDIG